MSDDLVLSGILVAVVGFALRLNPLLAVTLAAQRARVMVISIFGAAFNDNRYISVVWIVLPVIGLLERYGLQQRASRDRVGPQPTMGRLLLLYPLFRQMTAPLGLTSVASHVQTVRPLCR